MPPRDFAQGNKSVQQTTRAEGRALHKHDICEAKHAKQKNTEQSKIKHKHATNFTGADGKALHKPGVCEAKHGKQKLLNKTRETKF